MSTPSAEHGSRSYDLTRDDHAAVPFLRHGQSVSLIRWSRVDGDWCYTTVLGQYVHRDERYWYLVVRGVSARLDRAEWAIFN
ncbi:hypothetical protein [Leifsonia sp. TF02-11]|uniref:hypothetical protein n=1 Tax=Leifsonia sp. TF02-11 TaxID=2815212 RepID=UPI001AA17444|nr:hypothetical protein [Leifsonia sp. TF02-11]MBN9631078.1 hypothetical protein [Actinomycetota bacterium]MBO1740235.1 hypothetical protein [Leifsonia sp. TF02-11]